MSKTEKAVTAISKVIDRSNEEVLLVSGALAHEVYNNPQVIESIERALKRQVRFDIIVGPKYDSQSEFLLKRLKDNICTVQSWPDRHFVVGDRRHFRFEPSHTECSDKPAADNILVFDMPDSALMLVDRFLLLKNDCKPLMNLQVEFNQLNA